MDFKNQAIVASLILQILSMNPVYALTNITGGGFGGNVKSGLHSYEDLSMSRDDAAQLCYLQNQIVTVKNYSGQGIMSFSCPQANPEHNNIYWNGKFDEINKAYSPANDALYSGLMLSEMYLKWYQTPVFAAADGKAMMLNLLVHNRQRGQAANAYWDPLSQVMVFGDGSADFYPMVSIGIAAHEISHGFTSQHSKLIFGMNQSGAMNEAFSDMAAQAAEVYVYGEGQNSWKIGSEVMKAPDQAIRYMDRPSRDGHSVDNANQYFQHSRLDPHLGSGVFNRFFYILSNMQGWGVQKTFAIMVHANQYYWTSTSTFNAGACGVIQAARDYGYDIEAVKQAFAMVQVRCQ